MATAENSAVFHGWAGVAERITENSPRQRDLDQGSMSPVAYAPKELTAADEAKIRALVKKA